MSLALGECLAGESAMGGCGDAVALHELLCKILAPFEASALTARTDNGNLAQLRIGLEVIGDALHERILGTHDYHRHLVAKHKVANGIEIVSPQRDILAHQRRTGIAGRNEETQDTRRLGNLPCQCVLAAAAAQQENGVHAELVPMGIGLISPRRRSLRLCLNHSTMARSSA